MRDPIEKDELILIISPSHRWAEQGTVSKEELMQEPFITRELGSGTREVIEEALARQGIPKLNVVMELGNSSAIKTAVAADLGFQYFPAVPCTRSWKAVFSSRPPSKDVTLKRDFYLITVAERYNSPASVKFRELLVTVDGSTGLVPELA